MEFRYTYQDQEYIVALEPQAGQTYLVRIDGREYDVQLVNADNGQLDMRINGVRKQFYAASALSTATDSHHHYVASTERWVQHYELVQFEASKKRRRGGGLTEGNLTAQMPGQVMSILARVGETVQKGQTILTLEAMKMELRLTAPYDGVLTQLWVQVGDTVERGQQLSEIQPIP